MSIKVTNLTKIYGKQKALDNVSFEIASGQVVGFLGPNGAGKSTMMKILSCFLPQTEGSALVCGFDVNDSPMEVRKNVGYLPEHNPLYLDMYVKEYLLFIAGLHKINSPLNRVKEMISLTGLEVEQNKKIGALSKGYRQRVGLAQSLIHNPGVLILDEPTSGLDPNQIGEIRNLIKTSGKEKTVLLSTHIMQEVSAVCDRVIIINKGKIVADDNTEVLRKSSTDKHIVIVEFDKEVRREDLVKIKNITSAEGLGSNRWKIHAATAEDIRPELFRFAVEKGLTVLTMQKEEQTLEDIFRQLTV